MAIPGTQFEAGVVERQFLDLLREWLRERGKAEPPGGVSLRSNLQRDLGFDAGGLAEFLVRCETAFEVELPGSLVEEAETAAGWVKAILEAGAEKAAEARYRIPPPPEEFLAEPAGAASLAEVLTLHAETDPGRVHIHVLEGRRGEAITYGALYDEASLIAAGLADLGLRPGETVAVMLPTSADFFAAFFGVMFAGGVPVPVYPPTRPDRIEDYVRRQAVVLRRAAARYLIAFPEVRTVVQLLRVMAPSLVEVATMKQLRRARGRLGFGSVRLPELAVLQFTSGSTGDPKPVALTHASVLNNVRGIGAAIEVRPGDALVSWLPLYSDLGLIGCWLFSLYYSVPLTVLSPLEFLQAPERWLWAIHDSRGTLSAGPNFAYELCTRRIPAWKLEGLDLSTWRVAVNAGEPVLPATVDRFTRRFAPYGFRAEAFLPCYGLAEAAVALTMPPVERLPVRDRVRREEFEKESRAVAAAADDATALCFFSNGRPIQGQQIRLVDEQGREVPERTVGRLLFRGVTTMKGYYRDAEATAAVMREGGWVDSGDYGYLAGGEFYFTGRSKEAIVKAGRVMNPLHVEAALGSVAGVVPGSAVVFGVPEAMTGAELLVVVAETGANTQEDFRRIEAEITRVVDSYLGMPPDRIQLVAPDCLPRTPNGKIRRNEIRSLYQRGRLRTYHRPPWLQMLRLRWENIGSLALLALHRARVAAGRRLTNAAGAAAALAVGAMVRLTGQVRLIPPVCRAILRLHAQRFSLQGAGLLDEGKPAVLVANRSGLFDPLAVAAAMPRPVRFADRAALLGLPRALAWLLEPLVLGSDEGFAVPAAGRVRERVYKALKAGVVVVCFPDSRVGESVSRSRYRIDPFRAALETGAPLHPVSIRQRAAQQPGPERVRSRRATMIIVRERLDAGPRPDLLDLRDRAREAIGEYHA